MAYADWDFSDGATGYSEGSAVLNASLSNPLTDTNAYCRQYSENVGPGTKQLTRFPNAALDAGAWVGSDVANGFSIRGWLRSSGGSYDGGASNYRVGGHGMTIKGTPASLNGYHLWLGDGLGANLFGAFGTGLTGGYVHRLTLAMVNGGSTKFVDLRNELGTGTVDSTLVSRNRWYRVRIDHIPFGATQDVLQVYIDESGGGDPGTVVTGSETWTLLHTENVFSTDGHFLTANAAHRVGILASGYQPGGLNVGVVSNHTDAFESRKVAV